MATEPRPRLAYLFLVGCVIAVGLVFHSKTIPLSPMARKYVGDALWALMVFLGFGLIQNRASTTRIAIAAFSFAALIEISQLYHAPWIDSLRSTMFGILVLGSTFNWPDFIAYALGIGAGALTELTIKARMNSQ